VFAKNTSSIFQKSKILETPILSPKQPRTMYNPPLDSLMLFAAPKNLEKNKPQNRELNDQNSKFQLKFFKQFEARVKNFFYKKFSACSKLSKNQNKLVKIVIFSYRGRGP